jgi:hypothetical protein
MTEMGGIIVVFNIYTNDYCTEKNFHPQERDVRNGQLVGFAG